MAGEESGHPWQIAEHKQKYYVLGRKQKVKCEINLLAGWVSRFQFHFRFIVGKCVIEKGRG